MKKILSLLLVFYLASSCVTNYYYVNMEDDTPIYDSKGDGSKTYTYIPKGSKAYVSSSKKKYKRIKWNSYKGWAADPIYSIEKKSSYTKTKSSQSSQNNYTPKSSSGVGAVKVKGYHRKDGTYLRPHTRSAPRRK